MLQVCGSDDKTYTSSCAAGCANVKPQYTGACKPVATSECFTPILALVPHFVLHLDNLEMPAYWVQLFLATAETQLRRAFR